jgi:hypothetical protein
MSNDDYTEGYDDGYDDATYDASCSRWELTGIALLVMFALGLLLGSLIP